MHLPALRDVRASDGPQLRHLVVAAELFPPDDADVVDRMLADYLAGSRDEGHVWTVDEHDGQLVGLAYYKPLAGTDRTWELLMFAVRADLHRRGRGTVLLEHVLRDLRGRGQRLLLVHTSATAAFDRARAFYVARGFTEEGRVRDYYEDGDDMVVLRRRLAERTGSGAG